MKIKFFLIFILINKFVFAQEISGIVSKTNNIPIENANVTVWNSDKKETLVGYCYTNEKGFFYIKIKPEIQTVFIEVSCLDFASTSKRINISGNNQKVDFVLETKETELEEVIVKDEKAIRVKNDTTFYDPKKFLSGTERKVEDLIKKLPGMTVNEKTGEIKYKGKSIETVKLEDDDLFGGNYAIGTKNISVDMVEQLQAIEYYSDNPLLKGIEDSGKVAINLKLKKQKTDYSGTIEAKNGFSDKVLFNDEVTLLGISKTIKSFGIASYNNFGGGSIDLNNLSQGFNSSEIPEKDFYAKKLLSEPSISSNLPENRTKFNNSKFANYNFIYKLSKKISIKNNLVFFNDNSTAFESFSNSFLTNNFNLQTSQDNYFNKKALCFKSDIKFTINLSKNSLLVSSLSFSKQYFKSNLESFQNKTDLFVNDLQTNDLFFKSKTNYTWRINNKKALQFYSELSKNNAPQQLTISPNIGLFSGKSSLNSNQYSNFKKQFFINKITFLENRKDLKHTISLGFVSELNPLISTLQENMKNVVGFRNNISYQKTNLFWEYSSSINYYNIKVIPYISSNFFSQILSNNETRIDKNKSNLVYNGSLSLSHKLKKNGSIFLSGNFDNKTPDEEFLFENNIVESYNFVKSNIPLLEILKSQSLNLGYKYYDLSKQFGFDLNLQYQNRQNTFLSNITINPDFTFINYFQNPTNIENKSIFLSFDKQLKSLNLYLKQTSSFSVNNYKNTIDNLELRNNISKNLISSLLLFSSFDFPINLENNINFNLSNFTSDNNFTNQRIALNNTFKIIFKKSDNWIYSLTQDYFVTDTKLNNNFNFIDFYVKYKSQKIKWLSFNFTAKNLLNLKMFSEVNNNDFSTTVYSTNLLPRYFLISSNFSF